MIKIINESKKLKESRDGRKVYRVSMDVVVPAGVTEKDFSDNQGRPGKVYTAVSDALESVGCIMAGEWMEFEEDLTDSYDDNGFFDDIYAESIKLKENDDSTPYRTKTCSFDTWLEEEHGITEEEWESLPEDVAKEMYDDYKMTMKMIRSGKFKEYDTDLKESYYDGKVSIDELVSIKESLETLIETMDDYGQSAIQSDPNTYGIGTPFIGTRSGYVDLNNFDKYFESEEDEDEDDDSDF